MSSNPYSHVISGPPVYNITIDPSVDADPATIDLYYDHLLWCFHYLFPQGNPVVNQAMPANSAHHKSWYCDRFETVFTGALAPDHPVRRAVEYFVPSHDRGRGDFTFATLTARMNYLLSWEQSVTPTQQAASAPGTSQQSASASAQVQPVTAPAQTAAPSSPVPQPSRPVSGQFSLSQPSSRPASGSFSAASPKKQG